MILKVSKVCHLEHVSANWKALHKAAKLGHVEIVRLLIETGGAKIDSISSVESDGCTALQEAAYYGQEAVVYTLLEEGAAVNVKNLKEKTALLRAVSKNHANVVKALVECGADPNIQDSFGRTALHWAAWQGQAEIIRILLQNDASTTILDNFKFLPEDLAQRRHKNLLSLFKEYQDK